MREILFRAYQKNFKRMLPVDSIEYNNNEIRSITVDNRGLKGNYSVIPTYSIYSKDSLDFPLDSLILIQYIGLKDRNKVEIFEGDICIRLDIENYPRPLVVEWVEECACFSFVDVNDYHKNYFFQKQDMDNIKVIGNIHDNKYLLK